MKLLNGTINQFINYIKDKTLVCFGAGIVFNKFVNEYENYNIVGKINCIADNDVSKQGSFLSCGKDIPIVGIDRIKQLDNVVLLITCADVSSVFEQLSGLGLDNIVACFSANFIISYTDEKASFSVNLPKDFRLSTKQIIPKIIHYCWFGHNDMPDKNKRCVESWQKYCPDYEIRRWDETNYDVTKNKYMNDAYISKKWGFVPDYARLDIIYNYGGIYLDTDVELVKNLDDLLYQDAFAGVDYSKYVSLGLGFGAKSKYKIIKKLLEGYEGIDFIKADGELNMCPAPRIQKELFNSMGYINNGLYQQLGSMTIYPEIVLSGKNNLTGKINITDRTYAVHHYDGSWDSEEKKQKIIQNQIVYNKCLILD